MINLSIQNFFPFLVLTQYPVKIDKYQRKEGIETQQDPTGPSPYKCPSVSPISCLYGKGFCPLDLA